MKSKKRPAGRVRPIRALVVCGSLVTLLAGGCGAGGGLVEAAARLRLNDCTPAFPDAEGLGTADRIVLDFTGGFSRLHPDVELPPVAWTAFALADGGTLADAEQDFIEDVRDTIVQILCEAGLYEVQVRVGEAEDFGEVNVVHFTADVPTDRSHQMGLAEYDPCNHYHDNIAIVYGGQIARYGIVGTYGEWVNIFANLAAHEIGHTLGYSHVSRAEAASSTRGSFTELMLDGHTIDELRGEQRILTAQSTCPSASDITEPVLTHESMPDLGR
ncbi:MAG TPA: hypothetical protein PKK06_15590 [Phycisphaerae bacterium]|nr:hypothetical protein [Phycisphaerae bacterium]HNU45960.1 hypothetical protein [Phycisphaerae bacterium]